MITGLNCTQRTSLTGSSRKENSDHWLAFYDHRITLSARASTFGGIVNPICFAVLRLITSSNLVGCSTGRSAGLAPFKILST